MLNIKPNLARPSKLNLWLKAFLDENNPVTFFNRTGAAKAAGYRCSREDSFRTIGHENFIKLHTIVQSWLDEHGLDEVALKVKLLGLLNAKQTQLVKMNGKVDKATLTPEARVIVETGKDRETLLAIETTALETQRRALEMVLRMKGMYSDQPQQTKLLIEITPVSESRREIDIN